MARRGWARRGWISVAALVLVLAFPGGAWGRCANAGKGPTELTVKQAKSAAFCLINQRRQKRGLRKLHRNGRLAKAAHRHSRAMDALNFFSHYSLGGASPADRVAKTGYLSGAAAWGIGENLRWGTGASGSPKGAVVAWMKSAPHRRTMLSRRWRDLGIGFTRGAPVAGLDPNAAIWTADFGYRRG